VRGSDEGVHQETTRRELLVARHLGDPEVAGAKSVDEGYKVLKRKEEHDRRIKLAAEVGKTYSAETAHKVLNANAEDFLREALSEVFDVICTDPPYGIGADEFGDSGGHAAGAHFYEDSYGTWKNLIRTLAKESFRIAKPQAHLYCFCDITRFDEAKAVFADAGWEVFRTPIIWHKPNGNRLPWVDSGPQRKWELILYAKKGGKKVTRIYPDLVTYAADQNLGHPAQKPVALIRDLLQRSVNPGDSILDPFAGSGSLLVAASELKCKATAVEQDAAAYAICLERLKRLSAEPELVGLV
jgi:site-specific DNA-methyltransferase (adenine-specific)